MLATFVYLLALAVLLIRFLRATGPWDRAGWGVALAAQTLIGVAFSEPLLGPIEGSAVEVPILLTCAAAGIILAVRSASASVRQSPTSRRSRVLRVVTFGWMMWLGVIVVLNTIRR